MSIICHIDMDAFFASVEERDTPRFRGLPLVIGADPKNGKGRGVVSTASYAARRYGIHSALPISRAWRLAKEAEQRGEQKAMFLPTNMKRYLQVSKNIARTVEGNITMWEQASVDEFYGDLTFAGSYKKAKNIAKIIKKEIYKKEGLTCSMGIGPNRLVAKVASDHKKPDGLTVVLPNKVIKFLSPLSIRALPGVGPKAEATFRRLKISTVLDARALGEERLIELFGKWGSDMWQKINGQGNIVVGQYEPVKSIGKHDTFEIDTLQADFIVKKINLMCQKVIENLHREKFFSFRTVVLTVRFSDFKTKTRSKTFKEPIGDIKKFKHESLKLLLPFLDKRQNPQKKKIRLIGVRVEKLA